MYKVIFSLLVFSFIVSTRYSIGQMVQKEFFVKEKMGIVANQYEKLFVAVKDSFKSPRTFDHGQIRLVSSNDWTSGFFAGNLWFLYEYTGDTKWRQAAVMSTEKLEKEKNNTHTHDLGFMLYCSYGNGFRLTDNPKYKDVLLQGAKSLSTRYNEKVGCIKSWESRGEWQFPVIIDNMMNLEFLFWATKATGDSSFYNIAVSHADTTMKYHFRPDFSSYHVVNYDSITGKVISRQTAQGAADSSAWARGQSWGLYGYTLMYRETGKKKYLEQAQQIADYILKRLPTDFVTYWDYDAPGIPNEPRDASAAAIASSALFELSTYVDKALAKTYYSVAEKILLSISSPEYLANSGENGLFLLKHSVGHKPAKSEMDVPLIYADYYYIEALLRYNKSLSARP